MNQSTTPNAGNARRWIFVASAVAAALCVCIAAVAAILLFWNRAGVMTATPTAVRDLPGPTNAAPTAFSGLPEAPAGFDWRGVPGVSPAFLVPTGWYFTSERGPGFNSYYVTKEKDAKNTSWVFSTGLSVNVSDNPDQANMEFARNFIDQFAKKATTTKVVSSSKNEQGDIVSYQLLIEAEYPNVAPEDPNRKKTVFYTNILDKTTHVLYLVSFESPASLWDSAWETGKPLIDSLSAQISAGAGRQDSKDFGNTLANTMLLPVDMSQVARPTGMQPAIKSKLLATAGGGFLNTVPASGEAWRERYFLTLEPVGKLPPGAVLEVSFENPQDATTSIIVRLYNIPSGSIYVQTPALTGFKCQNYWVAVHLYSDVGQTQELDSYAQWLNSQVDLDKVTSVSDFANNGTCR